MNASSTALIGPLPLELFSKVVSNVLHGDGPRVRDRNVHATLRLVNRCWKAVLDSNPLFWTSIVIDKSAHRDNHTLPKPSSLARFPSILFALRHSRSLPLDITIILPDAATSHFPASHACKLGNLLLRQVSRIRSLDVSGADWILHLALLSPFHTMPMIALERFTHTVCDKPELSGRASFQGVMDMHRQTSPMLHSGRPAMMNAWMPAYFPSLKCVQITGAPYSWIYFPTAGLTKLRLSLQPLNRSITTSDLRRMLSAAAQTLEELEVSCVLNHSQLALGNLKPVILPALHTLSFTYGFANDVIFTLPHIRAPALKHFSLRDESIFVSARADPDTLLSTIMEFLPVEQFESLSLTNTKVSDPPVEVDADNVHIVLRFLRSLKKLRFLDLSMPRTHATIWRYLNFPYTESKATEEEAETPQYPVLHTLELIDVSGGFDEIMKFLRRRRQPTPLRVSVAEFVARQMTIPKYLIMENRVRELAWLEPDLECPIARALVAKTVLEDVKGRLGVMV